MGWHVDIWGLARGHLGAGTWTFGGWHMDMDYVCVLMNVQLKVDTCTVAGS